MFSDVWGKKKTQGLCVKPAQFLTDKAQIGTNRFGILPGVSSTKKIRKGLKKFMLWRDLVITVMPDV